MKKIIAVMIGLFVSGPLTAGCVVAGERFFVGVGSHHFVGHGGSFFFGSRHFQNRFFVEFGVPGAPVFFPGRGRWDYSYLPPMSVPYSTTPGDNYRGGDSDTDPQGGLHIDGYRVMPSGWLRVQVEPTDAQVLIDGFPAVLSQPQGKSASIGLLVGSHSVEVYRSGFQTYRKEVEIKQAREVFLRVKLDE